MFVHVPSATLSAPPRGTGPFAKESAADRAPPEGARGEGAVVPSSETTRLEASTRDDASSLRLELKARTRQTHKLQEVCAGLKRRFVEGGGSASAFELGKDVCEARYELKACEQKRLAERDRAEQLARELEKARRALATLETTAGAGVSRASGLAARAVNSAARRAESGGEGKQTNGARGGAMMMRGTENAA